MSRDRQTQVAWKKKWDASTLPATITGGLHEGPIAATDRPPMIYTAMTCKPDGRANQVSAGGGEIDYRRVKLVTYGSDEQTVATAMGAIDAVFNDQVQANNNSAAAVLDFGTDADWMRTERVPETGDLLERGEVINSQRTWKGTQEFRVHTSRPKGA